MLDPSQPLDVDKDQLTRPLALVADCGLQPETAGPILVMIPDTVESGMSSTSTISGPVNRTRLKAAIASTRG